MKTLLKAIKKISIKMYSSIAFYPLLISAAFLIFGVIMIWIEQLSFISSVKDDFPHLIIKDVYIAQTLLSVLIGGILSLTVFSFTMVMVVLNQAASNFSPRLLPGLISDKRHQIILGFYIGTLLYCLINLISMGAAGTDASHSGLSVMIAAVWGVVCLALFVSFIHSISSSIQIHNIVRKIFREGDKDIDCTLEKMKSHDTLDLPDTSGWDEIIINRSGYFKGFDISLIEDSIKKEEKKIEILPHNDAFLWEGAVVMKINNRISEEEKKSLLFALHISSDRHSEDNYLGSMIKLMEIAVKAMSPGINDPGTAIEVIGKLGQLLKKALEIPLRTAIKLNDCPLYIIYNHLSTTEIMQSIIQPIRMYAKADRSVMAELIQLLKFVASGSSISHTSKQQLISELQAIEEDIQHSISTKKDRQMLQELLAM